MEQDSPKSMAVPIWAIAIIAILVVAIIILIIFYLRRRRTRSYSVETIHRSEDYPIKDHSIKDNSIKEMKQSESLGSFQTLVTQQKKQRSMKFDESSITTTPLPTPPLPNIKQQQLEGTTSPLNTNNNKKADKPASIFDESDYSYSTPPEPSSQEIKISLPLPPPSSSFFSDKMELNGDHGQDLFNMYLNSKPTEKSEFISIDLETGPSFYSSATANIQQKAATMKNSLYQSLRIQKGNSGRSSAQHMFSEPQQKAPKNSGDSYGYQPESSEKTQYIHNSSTITTDSNKTVIDMREFNNTTKQPLKNLTVTRSSNDMVAIDDESPITPNPNLQEPVRAAKRVIRSASRKTKTRSMVVNEKDLLPIEDEESTDYQGLGGTVKDSKKSKRDSVRFASFRGPRNSGEHMTITSGSMRRLVRESILFDDDAIPSMPPSAAAMASTRNTNSRKSNISAVDIASWWESNSNTPKNSNSATITANEDSDNSLPLSQNISAGSNSSGAPHQYRASLTTSIFGTLSKSSAAVLNEANHEAAGAANGNATRHNSFRRGTLSRNTLRNITAGATNVNRSIKGLFDNSSSKVVPDDSQKMELDSEPAVQNEEKLSPHERYGSIRQKSVRNTTQTRPSIPSTYLPNSESSTKYALSDEDYFPDQQNSAVDQKLDDQKKLKEEPKQGIIPTSANSEVDTIRRMLQDTWKNNMKESGSMFSISSETESVATNSTQQSGLTQQSASTAGTSKFVSRHQNQSLLTKSLLTQQVVKRASLLGRTRQSEDFVPQQGPEPTASFSSSTARTMVPEAANEPASVRLNAINHGSNKIQQNACDNVLLNRLSTSPTSPRNSSANSSRGHSRKSSGGNSAATALRISSGYAINAKTWNGRANQKRNSRPLVTQILDGNDDETPSTPDTAHLVSPVEQSIGRASVNKRAFFSTMRKGQKNRGSIPWMAEGDDQDKTPAQIERDKYLEGKF
ncbi:hypothetical protein INT47_001542 [Mucor saturninus]|uniref:Uncharacterized protein n=1 Tax=Mucor saturninus TaxID=64648 RepID=A0A8H7V1K0_9FUNG|nr:hypothetical protein INT47_001542 [Mucor saturninus]